MYFNKCKTLQEVKSLYKNLAKENHPDMGGNTAIMQAINTEYAYACVLLAKGAGLSDEQTNEQIKMSEAYRHAIEKIIHLPGIIIELVGNWIWVTGNTKLVKDDLYNAGYWFAPKKVAWYFRTDEFKCSGTKKSLDQIRAKYGSEIISKQKNGRYLDR